LDEDLWIVMFRVVLRGQCGLFLAYFSQSNKFICCHVSQANQNRVMAKTT